MGFPVTGSILCLSKWGVMAEFSKRMPSGVHTGVVYGVRVSAQQSKGRGRVEAEPKIDDDDRSSDWLARCSRADWYCFSFWRLGMMIILVDGTSNLEMIQDEVEVEVKIKRCCSCSR